MAKNSSKQQAIDRILSEKIFAVVRLTETERISELLQTLRDAGIRIFEITLTMPGAFAILNQAVRDLPDCLVGAGTVIGYDAAVSAIESGAKFLVSPVTDLDMLAVAKEMGVPSVAGALTPTEAWQATEAGADFVKVFPLAGLGPSYISAMLGPLPNIRFIATNGVSPETIPDFLNAGCTAVGLGSSLVTDADMNSDFTNVAERAKAALQALGWK